MFTVEFTNEMSAVIGIQRGEKKKGLWKILDRSQGGKGLDGDKFHTDSDTEQPTDGQIYPYQKPVITDVVSQPTTNV